MCSTRSRARRRGPIYRALLRRRWLSRLRGVRSTRSRAWRRCCLSRRSGRPRRRAGWTSFDGWCRAGFLCRALCAGSSQGIGARRAAARRGWFRYLFLAVWRLRRGALCFGASGSATCSRFYLLVGIWGFRCVGHEEDPLLSSDRHWFQYGPGRGQAHARTLYGLASHFVVGYGRGLVPALAHYCTKRRKSLFTAT